MYGPTSALGSVVRNAKLPLVVSPSFTFRTDVQRPNACEKAIGRLSSKANHNGGRRPFGRTSFSEKLVNATRQRLSSPSHRPQCGDETLRTFVTPPLVPVYWLHSLSMR